MEELVKFALIVGGIPLNNNEILAKNIMDNLFKKGIECMWYISNTSNSIYIALDNGAIGSIRISDHISGTSETNCYRYNVLTSLSTQNVLKWGNSTMYLFPVNDINIMIEYISMDKQNRLTHFGELGYNRYKRMMLSKYLYHKKGWKLYVPGKEILEEV